MKNAFYYFIILSFLSACGMKGNSQSSSYLLSPTEFEQTISKTKDAVIIDVCTAGEFEQRHLKGALNVDYNRADFKEAINLFDKSKPTFIYCFKGGRSAEAYDIMKDLGFTNLYELKGGISKWMDEGKPTEAKNIDPNKGISESVYQNAISSNTKTLVVFSTDWCPPCKKLNPIIDEIIASKPTYTILKYDGDENAAQCKRVDANAFPTLILYKDGKEVWRHLGMIEKEELLKKINESR